MNLGEYIKRYREEHGKMSGRAFAELVGLSPQYIANLQRGKNNAGKPLSPTMETYAKIAKGTGISETELLSMVTDSVRVNPKEAKPRQSELEKKFNALDEHGKAVVLALLDMEYERCVQPVPLPKVIPLFPAAAGPGEPISENAFEEYKVNGDSKADFAVRISGDSMEPEFHDGQIVLCEKRIPHDGEIAVMMVDGFLVVKQFVSAYGNIYLRSLNRERKNLDIDILESGNETVQGWGTVIYKRIPLVEQ